MCVGTRRLPASSALRFFGRVETTTLAPNSRKSFDANEEAELACLSKAERETLEAPAELREEAVYLTCDSGCLKRRREIRARN